MPSPVSTRIAATLLSLVLLVAACSGSSSDDADDAGGEIRTLDSNVTEVATGAGDLTTEDASNEAPDEERTIEDAQLEFAVCIRESGYPEWPDPDPNAEGGAFRGQDLEALGIDFDDQEFREALDSCRSVFEGVAGGREDLDPEQQAEREDQALALFACIRQNPGWEDIPDPDFSSQGGGGLRELFINGDLDVDEFRTLAQECQTELGIEGGGFGGGRGPGRSRPASGG
ncbi:MAG: hypothetical protein GY708_31160 [Actinomycetia bacterium]|nr:hypothetical protein [Actinomycetes bacterium]MCP4958603.1 hypothetical protein [Actinomycetes bacterium]